MSYTFRVVVVVCLLMTGIQPLMASCPTPVFGSLDSIPGGHDVTDYAVGDLGNDGDLDIVTVSAGLASFAANVHINDDGVYLAPFGAPAVRATDVELADVNGDGKLDIVVVEQSADLEACRLSGSCASVHFLEANDDGGFSNGPSMVVPYADFVKRITTADFDKDGKADVLVAAPPIAAGDPSIHLLWGGGTISTFIPNGPIGDVAAGDFNGDGYADFVAAVGASPTVANSHVDFYTNNSGTFPSDYSTSRTIISTSDNLRLVTGQFNQENTTLDLGLSMETTTSPYYPGSGMEFLLGDGMGNFQEAGTRFLGTTNVKLTDITAADINEDLYPDLIGSTGSSAFAVAINDGHGQGLKAYADIEGAYGGTTGRPFAGDHDFDGRTDLFFLSLDTDDVLRPNNLCPWRYLKLSIAATPSPSPWNTNATVTVTFTTKPDAPQPEGFVTLYDGGTQLAQNIITSGRTSQFTLSNLALGQHWLRAEYEDPNNRYAKTSTPGIPHDVVRPPFGAPLNVTATGNNAANAITIRWFSTADATTHEVLRRDNGQWVAIGSVGGATESFIDANRDATKAYVYAVRSTNANGATSANSNIDVATTMNAARPADKKIRALDTTEVRSLANSLRSAAGLGAFAFTDATLSGKVIKGIHLAELRTAIAQARAALGLPAVAASQPAISAKVTKVKYNDLQELRTSFY